MALMHDKKGFFFTILVIVMISLFLLTYGIYNQFKERSSEQKRVETLDSFLKAVEEDLGRQVYIVGFRALFIIESKMSETGTYNPSVSNSVKEIAINGTFNQEPQSLMIGTTWKEIENTINEKAAKLNANITLGNPVITVYQETPWKVTVHVNTTIDIQDKKESVRWQINESLKAQIGVENFEDPLYLLNTNGLVTNKIARTPYTLFVQGTNVSNLLAHATNSYYRNTSLAPSFIQRLEGNLNASTQGIESIVNLPELSAAGISVLDKSSIDYIYFSTENPSTFRVQGMPAWFKIDSSHVALYDVGNLTF